MKNMNENIATPEQQARLIATYSNEELATAYNEWLDALMSTVGSARYSNLRTAVILAAEELEKRNLYI